MSPVRLSKSRIMAALQCAKRVHLEVNRRDLAKFTSAAEAAFETGHEVGAIALRLLGGEKGTLIEYNGGSFTAALAETRRLMSSTPRAPVYEATLQHDGVLVREDILLPAGDSWRFVEVKASTQLKPEHLQDCAVQAWVHRESAHPLKQVSLAHVDSSFVYPGDGDYRGLLVEHDVTEAVFELLPLVPGWVERARAAASGPMPQVPVGLHCGKPYDCPFMEFCWPQDSAYPIQGLGGGRERLGQWVAAGCRDIRDVPAHGISAATQQRIHRVTRAGQPELLPGAGDFMRALTYPRYFLDFETVAPVVPRWAGTRPYEPLPFQWSCHVERARGKVEQLPGFLDISGAAPMRPAAESLIAALGSEGPVLMYTGYERRVIEGLAARFPDLAPALTAIAARLVDLHPVVKASYYHPDMLGSWSIKAVLPTIAPELDYSRLAGIQEGTEASAAWFEAVDSATTPTRREELREQLSDYCAHDTAALVALVHFFERQP